MILFVWYMFNSVLFVYNYNIVFILFYSLDKTIQSSKKSTLKKYAHLIAKVGANIQNLNQGLLSNNQLITSRTLQEVLPNDGQPLPGKPPADAHYRVRRGA